ncbi:hypothetical protein K457DRAFT_12974 [Linnemannia elongata AG-77]|uniref:Uncharacterized protein n=1 Tax=Linnemannia elongata AG-77 TaxID=1314771 RepID=A0A197KGF4_9FUNG|nr:hypothetical protein K457DRAFT_12974 [Linnemannia elongata AG-77]
MTPEQAITILDALFSKLGSIQRSRLSPAPPFSSEINGFVQEDISFDTISDAIWTLGNNDTRPTLQVFFDQVFSSLHAQIIDLNGKDVDMLVALEPRLDAINRITLATYHACTRPRRNSWVLSDSVSELGILFQSIVSQVLEPLWILFSEMRQQYEEVGGSQGDEKSIHILLQVEIVMASLLRALLVVREDQRSEDHSSETHLIGFTGLFYLVVRIFDEALLPQHLSPECSEDVIHLVAGLLTLLQIFRTFEHVNLVPAIQEQLLSGLLSSDIIERTIRSLQATNSDMAAATCELFIARLLCLGGVFSESCMACAAIWGPHAIRSLNKKKNIELIANDGRLLSITCKFDFTSVQGNEKSLDHLYGASWIELAYIYITLDQTIDPEGKERRPFSFLTILEGLKYSVQGAEEGSLSQTMLKLHAKEILVWFWSHDGSSLKDYITKDPPATLLRMMFMLLEEFSLKATTRTGQRRLLKNDGKMEHMVQLLLKYPLALCSIKTIFRDICQILESTPMDAVQVDPRWRTLCVVCSIIKSFAGYLPSAAAGQEDDAAKEFQFQVCEEVVDIAITLCVSSQAVEAELSYLWEMLDTVMPLLKPCDGKEPLIEWGGYRNLKRVVGKLLFQVEQCQAGTVWQGQHRMTRFFKSMWSNIRVLSIHLDIDDEYILEDQPELLTSLEEAALELMDRLLLASPETILSNMMNQYGADWQETWSCVADCAVEAMLFLHNTHTRFPNSVLLTIEEDRALMVHFCLELMDELVKGRYVAYQPQPASDPRVLAFLLVPWVTNTLSEGLGSGPGSEGLTVEVLVAWLEMLLDGLCESLLREADDTMVWKTLRVYTKALLTCFHQRPSPSSSSTETTASKTATRSSRRLELIVYPAPQESSTHAWIRSRLRYQGHKELLSSLWRRWDAGAKALLDRIRKRASQAEGGAVYSALALIPFDRSGGQGQQVVSEYTYVDKQVVSQLGRAVSDILTLMRMIVHEGPKQGHQCRQQDLEFVSWIMELIDSQPVTDVAQTLRDLSVVALAPAPISAPAKATAESNEFASSLNELTRIHEECVRAHALYRT